jgi:hypothetical protein
MKPCGSFLCPEKGRMSRGVLISAYSKSEPIFHRLSAEANDAGRSAKSFSPELPTALITHRPEAADPSAFDYVIPVRTDLLVEGALREAAYTPQWFTRLYYYASSPFNVTIAIDSNAGFCSSPLPLLEAASRWDFAVPSQLRDDCGLWPHNFLIAYVSESATTVALFREWVLMQLQKGVPLDDQETLWHAMYSRPVQKLSPRLGRITSLGAISLLTLDTTFFKRLLPAVTPIFTGQVALIHPRTTGLACPAWNDATTYTARGGEVLQPGWASRPHVLVATELAGRLTPAFSPDECAAIANQSCAPACPPEKGPWVFEGRAPAEMIVPAFGPPPKKRDAAGKTSHSHPRQFGGLGRGLTRMLEGAVLSMAIFALPLGFCWWRDAIWRCHER